MTYFLSGKIYLDIIGIVTKTSFLLIAVMVLFATSLGSNMDIFLGLHPANMPVFMKYGQIRVMWMLS